MADGFCRRLQRKRRASPGAAARAITGQGAHGITRLLQVIGYAEVGVAT